MPSARIVKRSAIAPSFRVELARGMFDVPNKTEIVHEWNVELPIEERPDWKIGLIVGQSGAGKSVIAREIFRDAYFHERFEWDEENGRRLSLFRQATLSWALPYGPWTVASRMP